MMSATIGSGSADLSLTSMTGDVTLLARACTPQRRPEPPAPTARNLSRGTCRHGLPPRHASGRGTCGPEPATAVLPPRNLPPRNLLAAEPAAPAAGRVSSGEPRLRHGRLRLYLLKLLDEAPRHGYEVIRLLQDRFLGVYAPSPGTIYPRLARLEEEGLVTHDEVDGKKVYRITDKGREEIRARLDDLAELEEEITDSVRDIAREVTQDVRDTVRNLREELTWAASDVRREGREQAGRRRRILAARSPGSGPASQGRGQGERPARPRRGRDSARGGRPRRSRAGPRRLARRPAQTSHAAGRAGRPPAEGQAAAAWRPPRERPDWAAFQDWQSWAGWRGAARAQRPGRPRLARRPRPGRRPCSGTSNGWPSNSPENCALLPLILSPLARTRSATCGRSSRKP